MKHWTVFIVLALFIGLSSCNKDNELSDEDQLIHDTQLIEDYLESNNFTAEKTTTGVYYIISNEGTGTHPSINSNVTVQYTGKLLDGTGFDSNTATFPLTAVIEGWQIGIPLFKTNGRGKLIIPSTLGYGSAGSGDVPPNAVLVFDIHLISFN